MSTSESKYPLTLTTILRLFNELKSFNGKSKNPFALVVPDLIIELFVLLTTLTKAFDIGILLPLFTPMVMSLNEKILSIILFFFVIYVINAIVN
jgi:hypothetical protein